MGMAMGGAFGNMAQNLNPPQPAAPATPAAEDPITALKKLKEMLDLELITQADFDAKKADIMGRM